MKAINIPGFGNLEIKRIILDLNGTIAIDGKLISGVKSRIKKLKKIGCEVFLFTGDTHGNSAVLAKKLGIKVKIAKNSKEKASKAAKLNSRKCVTIGNGKIDHKLFKAVALSVLVIQKEGANTKALMNSDVITTSICYALDLFIYEKRLIATLRD